MQDERQWQNMYIPHRKDNSCNEKMCASGERQGIQACGECGEEKH